MVGLLFYWETSAVVRFQKLLILLVVGSFGLWQVAKEHLLMLLCRVSDGVGRVLLYKVLRLILVRIIIPWVNWRDHLSAESFCYQIAEIQGWFDLQRSVRRAVALVLGHA